MSKFWHWGTAGLASVKWEQGLTNARTADCKMDPAHDPVGFISQGCGAFTMTYLRKGKDTEERGGAAGIGAEIPLQLMKDPCWSRNFSVASWGSHSRAGGWISLKEAIDHEEQRKSVMKEEKYHNYHLPTPHNPNLLWKKMRSLRWSWAWEDRVEKNSLFKVCLFFSLPESILISSK